MGGASTGRAEPAWYRAVISAAQQHSIGGHEARLGSSVLPDSMRA
jgi:hypothetical protein